MRGVELLERQSFADGNACDPRFVQRTVQALLHVDAHGIRALVQDPIPVGDGEGERGRRRKRKRRRRRRRREEAEGGGGVTRVSE